MSGPREGPPPVVLRLGLAALVLVLLAASGWAIYAQVTSRAPILVWDMHIPLRAIQALLHEGLDPYSQEVTLATEMEMLGRPSGLAPYELRLELAYPLYLMVLLGPLTLVPLPVAQAIWYTVIEASILGLILLTPRVAGWRPPLWLAALTALFTIGLYPNLWAIFLGQISIVVAATVVLGWWSLKTERWVLAGMCLALSTLKPQIVFLFVPGVLAWAILQRRWSLVLSFGLAMIALILLPLPWLPAWPLSWLEAMGRYTGYTIYESPLAMLLQSRWLVVAAGACLVAWTVHHYAVAPPGSPQAREWAFSMLLVTAALLAPRTSHVNQIVLLAPILVVFSRLPSPRVVALLQLVLLVGLWAADLGLAPPGGLEHMVWQHRVISPVLPAGLALALIYFRPPAARGAGQPERALRPEGGHGA